MKKNIKVNAIKLCCGLLLVNLPIIIFHPSVSSTEALPLNPVSSSDEASMYTIRTAGLNRDRKQVGSIVLLMQNVRTLHPSIVQTALHALSQIGDIQSAPVFDSVIAGSDDAGQHAYARVAKARLLAEAAADAEPDSDTQAKTCISVFMRQMNLSPSDIQDSVVAFYEERRLKPAYPSVGVLALREIADIMYQHRSDTYVTDSNLSSINFSIDEPSALKVQLANYSDDDRAKWLIDDLATGNLKNERQAYEQQLVLDCGNKGISVAIRKLSMTDQQLESTNKIGTVALLNVLGSSGDTRASNVIEIYKNNKNPDVAATAKSFSDLRYNNVSAQANHPMVLVPGY